MRCAFFSFTLVLEFRSEGVSRGILSVLSVCRVIVFLNLRSCREVFCFLCKFFRGVSGDIRVSFGLLCVSLLDLNLYFAFLVFYSRFWNSVDSLVLGVVFFLVVFGFYCFGVFFLLCWRGF